MSEEKLLRIALSPKHFSDEEELSDRGVRQEPEEKDLPSEFVVQCVREASKCVRKLEPELRKVLPTVRKTVEIPIRCDNPHEVHSVVVLLSCVPNGQKVHLSFLLKWQGALWDLPFADGDGVIFEHSSDKDAISQQLFDSIKEWQERHRQQLIAIFRFSDEKIAELKAEAALGAQLRDAARRELDGEEGGRN